MSALSVSLFPYHFFIPIYSVCNAPHCVRCCISSQTINIRFYGNWSVHRKTIMITTKQHQNHNNKSLKKSALPIILLQSALDYLFRLIGSCPAYKLSVSKYALYSLLSSTGIPWRSTIFSREWKKTPSESSFIVMRKRNIIFFYKKKENFPVVLQL